ncbi:UvrD-helicase domain-containing protein [Bacillus anthracis]|uniref:UvrD-helicase domain-containing protein n=1 Tax=Bacillus anthracis TaxID=1392 RepID=UPI003D1A3A48
MVGEVEKKVFDCIENSESFIIEAGAGSGKTWTLVQSLLYIVNKWGEGYKKYNKKVMCITYTNVAKEEIIDRVQANDLVIVKTIHDFLWTIVKPFQKEIKHELIFYIEEKLNKNQSEIRKKKNRDTKAYKKLESLISMHNEALEALKLLKGKIQYKEFSSIRRGIISHDEVLYIANKIIKKSPIIQRIIQDSYPIIFIDEYQDTHKDTAETLLEYLKVNTGIIFGFFGDYYQKIYDGSVGKIDAEQYRLKIIKKTENYRCAKEVIDLLNKLRNDIKQKEAGKIKKGKCLFYYVDNSDINTESFIDKFIRKDFNIKNEEEIKNLYLVTKTIAKKNNYLNLYELYDEKLNPEGRRKKRKDQLIKNKDNRDCIFANFLYDIEEVVELYKQNKIQALLKKIPYELKCFEDKRVLNENLNKLCEMRSDEIIRDVIEYVCDKKIISIPDKLQAYLSREELQDEFFIKLMDLHYYEFRNLYYTVKDTSPFSTNHGTKGAEFDNVVCFIDDSDWKNYSINNYFDDTDLSDGKEQRYERTQNLFYVICSRAKYNLAIVLLSKLSLDAKDKAKSLFGTENYFEMEKLI